jgi:hypothetical protein
MVARLGGGRHVSGGERSASPWGRAGGQNHDDRAHIPSRSRESRHRHALTDDLAVVDAAPVAPGARPRPTGKDIGPSLADTCPTLGGELGPVGVLSAPGSRSTHHVSRRQYDLDWQLVAQTRCSWRLYGRHLFNVLKCRWPAPNPGKKVLHKAEWPVRVPPDDLFYLL